MHYVYSQIQRIPVRYNILVSMFLIMSSFLANKLCFQERVRSFSIRYEMIKDEIFRSVMQGM